MNNHSITDIEIEKFLIGKWRFNKDWEINSIKFKDDMTYEQIKVQTFILNKPSELITGHNFTGLWYVNERRLCLNLKRVPNSFFNLQLPILSQIDFADMAARLTSLFITEKYEVININSTQFLMKDVNKSIVGIKIN
ncbi:hypothetical protein [Nodularia sp. NIES-3585]|uniref:hypothetical protein n=1 Tax=Nodularia sp. NIES-3585 TaxID=1973477 RepID=UPI000B5CD816|nr:hypothetical protein [Nodularia sp. NIES-3585]GAX34068.1 hypothetical protein NIES3585_00670 [Nodularia sp. NIES-3585]